MTAKEFKELMQQAFEAGGVNQLDQEYLVVFRHHPEWLGVVETLFTTDVVETWLKSKDPEPTFRPVKRHTPRSVVKAALPAIAQAWNDKVDEDKICLTLHLVGFIPMRNSLPVCSNEQFKHAFATLLLEIQAPVCLDLSEITSPFLKLVAIE